MRLSFGFEVPFSNDRVVEGLAHLQAFYIRGGIVFPNESEKIRVMRQNDNLLGMFYELPNQLLSTSAPEAILAREGIVQHNYFTADIGILFHCGKKKGQCECTPVSGTQCCFEAW